MIKQPVDRFKASRDPRPWTVIVSDQGYWDGFWIWKNATTCPSGNVFKFKVAANG